MRTELDWVFEILSFLDFISEITPPPDWFVTFVHASCNRDLNAGSDEWNDILDEFLKKYPDFESVLFKWLDGLDEEPQFLDEKHWKKKHSSN